MKIFESETPLPNERLAAKALTLLGFDERYVRVRDQLRLLLSVGELAAWNKKHHRGQGDSKYRTAQRLTRGANQIL